MPCIPVWIGPHVHAQARPAGEVARLRLPQFVGDAVHPPEQIGERKNIRPQLPPAINDALVEIRVLPQPAQPDVVRAAELREIPVVGQTAFEIVGVAPGEVPIPDRVHANLAPAILAHVVAQAVAVDVLGELDDPVLVHEGTRLDVFQVAVDRVAPVCAVERGLEGVEVIEQPGALGEAQIGSLRVVIFKELSARGGEIHVAGAVLVLLPNVAAGDVRLRVVATLELGDVDAVFIDANFFQEHVDAEVVIGREPARRAADEDLHEFAPHRVVAHGLVQFVGQVVIHEGLVRVGCVESPVAALGEAEQFGFEILARLIIRLEVEGFFRELRGTLAVDFDPDPAAIIKRPLQADARARGIGVEEHGVTGNLHVLHDGAAEAVHNDERQVAREVGQRGVEHDVVRRRHFAVHPARFQGPRADGGVGADRDRAGVEQGTEGGRGAVERVINRGR